jgi:iron complex outermembrane recepter protein
MKTFIILCCLTLAASFNALAQEEEQLNLDELSLEELMNVPIKSASKTNETLFDAPLSSYTIRRADIDRAGSTTIMEALRLAPGVIVREQANGVYDIQIRGLDNLLRTSETNTKANTSTLVMIDNRPVFNHNLGGTFWETLPIDLNDVDRIEIVRGPSAPLFGPNAVTGVINIITRKLSDDKSMVSASVQGGSSSTLIANAIAGNTYKKVSVIVSGNYQQRNRFEDTYYLPALDQQMTVDQLAGIFGDQTYSQYRNKDLALKKYGANATVDYKMAEGVSLDLTVGTQQSQTQKIFLSNIFSGGIPFTENKTTSSYANVSAKVKNFTVRSSYVYGNDNLAVNSAPSQYDFNALDASAEYTIKLGAVGTLVPGASYQHAQLSDKDYASEGLTFLGGVSQTIATTSGFVRTDLKPAFGLRVLGAVRIDKFSSPDKSYLAYELASTYKLNQKNIIRAAITRSNSGSFFGYNYLNLQVPIAPNVTFARIGSKDLRLYTVNMVEFGYRVQFSKSFHLDVDIFRQEAKNLTALVTSNGIVIGNDFQATEQKFVNVPTTAIQNGATLGLNFVPSEKIHIKPFVTIQKTETKDLASDYIDPALAANLDAPVTYSNSTHRNTPAVYGGYYVNYKATKNFNVNLNGYFFGNHTQYDQADPSATRKTGEIDGKFLLNTKVSYTMGKATLFVNGRNVLNVEKSEFYGADRTSGMILGGVNFSLN